MPQEKTKKTDCIFCRIVAGESPATIELETDDVVAFRNIAPVADIHILIVPKKHIRNFMQLDSEDKVLDKMRKAAQDLVEKFEISNGYKLIFNGGRYQAVDHLHWHLLGGRMKEDHT